MNKVSSSTSYKKGQHVVYPTQGVGKIIDIAERKFQENVLLYYSIKLNESDMMIHVPVDRAKELGIRLVVGKKEAEKVFLVFDQPLKPISNDWKQRYQQNLDLIKQGSIATIAEVVYSLYKRKKEKELPIMERKLYEDASNIFIDEISLALDISRKDAEKKIFSKIEQSIIESGKISAKNPSEKSS